MDEWPNWATFLARLAFGLALCWLLFAFGKWFGGQMLTGVLFGLFALPMIALLIRRPLIMMMDEGLSWMWHQPMQKFQGSYFAFDNVQVRIYEGVDGGLWLVAKDVLKAVGMKGVPDSFLAAYPDGTKVLAGTLLTAMDPASVHHLLDKRNDPQSIRFLQWMEREVIKPWERKQERERLDRQAARRGVQGS